MTLTKYTSSRTVPLVLLIIFGSSALADAQGPCLYRNKAGSLISAESISSVPRRYRKLATCSNRTLAKPQDIHLRGSLRQERISSPLGSMSLRWPRRVETLFGRTPLRAAMEAARAVKRTLSTSVIPPVLKNLDRNWQIVFLDEDLPEKQIPIQLISNCHPGWMTPPGNIYIVAQRVARGCSKRKTAKRVADSQLTRVFLHELGHAVEYALLGSKFSGDRRRAEGFATWFESYAANYSALLDANTIQREQFTLARYSYRKNRGARVFSGTAEDYARASMPFHAVARVLGVKKLMDIYEHMSKSGEGLGSSILKVTGWTKARLASEIGRTLRSR